MQLLSADAICFQKKLSFFLTLKNMKKPPFKVAHNRPPAFFLCTGPAA